MKAVDITGRRFGRLVAIAVDHTVKYSKDIVQHWLCKCDCGNTAIAAKPALLRGAIVSCGCYAREKSKENGSARNIDITGKRYGRLTAIKLDHSKKYKDGSTGQWWLCKCDCGSEVVVSKGNLGRCTRSCGCLSKETTKKINKERNEDITGKRFGRLVAIRLDHVKEQNHGSPLQYWLCRCDCGNEKVVLKYALGKSTFSCGCYLKEEASKRASRHGGANTNLYKRWSSMKERCFRKTHVHYKNYGGRGITVCDEWKNSFEAFRDWALNNGYEKGLQLDRIDNDGNYEPSNCRWATRTRQANNRRTNKYIEHNGERLTFAEWSQRLGASTNIVDKRMLEGWSEIDAITIKPHRGPHKERGE
jgi:hypothetical protein